MKKFIYLIVLSLFIIMLSLSCTRLYSQLLQEPLDYVPIAGMIITAIFCFIIIWFLLEALTTNNVSKKPLTGETQSTTVNVTFLKPDGETENADVPLLFNKTEEQSISTYMVTNYTINEMPTSYCINYL